MKTAFVIAFFNGEDYYSDEEGATVPMMAIGLKSDWDQEGCLSDGRDDEHDERIAYFANTYGISELSESYFDFPKGEDIADIKFRLLQEPDIHFDQSFQDFIASAGY